MNSTKEELIYVTIDRAFDQVRDLLDGERPPNREASLAVTNLEQALMWAGRALDVGGDA